MSESDRRSGQHLQRSICLSVEALHVEALRYDICGTGVYGHVCTNLMPCRWHKKAAFGDSGLEMSRENHGIRISCLIPAHWTGVTRPSFLQRALPMPGVPGQGIFFRRGHTVPLPECPPWRPVTVMSPSATKIF